MIDVDAKFHHGVSSPFVLWGRPAIIETRANVAIAVAGGPSGSEQVLVRPDAYLCS